MGIILLPSLTGGIVSQNSSASVETSTKFWSQSLLTTLSPVAHISNFGLFYFGLSIFLILVIGLFIKNKEIKPMFLASFIILISTSTAMSRIIGMLPLSQVFWMQRFVPIALVFAFVGIIYWKKCRKKVLSYLLIVIAIDCIATTQYLNPYYEIVTNECTLEKAGTFEEEYLLNEAKEIATNRISFLDLSNTNSYPSYFFSSDMDDTIPYMFGWAYQGAHTEKEMVRINEALEYGFYDYTLDRSIEMGCDTILVKKDEIGKSIKGHQSDKEQKFLASAKKLGFTLVKENEDTYLLKLQLPEGVSTFGTVTKYDNLAIGDSAHYITYLYPNFELGESNVLDDYSYEDLLQYQKIYLSNFSYIDKEYTEEMLTKLSNEGVDVYIDTNNIPTNLLTGKKEYFGVYSQFVTFTESFPIISMKNGSEFKLPMNTQSYDNWYCSYLSEVYFNKRGSLYYEGKTLYYYGTSENEKIHFIGFNLPYYCIQEHNLDLVAFFNEMFGLEEGATSHREIVKMDVEYSHKGINVTTYEDNVNTGFAYLDGFRVDKEAKELHHLMVVNEGKTTVTSVYPYFKEGLAMTIFGLVTLASFITFVTKMERKETE
jgi:uncharacterized membrane protein